MPETLLEIRDLSVRYGSEQWGLRGLNLTVKAGETVALMGASGCGKTTAAWAILRLLPVGALQSGSIQTVGKVSLIPQEPLAALNPVRRIGEQMREVDGGQARASVKEMIAQLGLPERAYSAYPHELSGGQLQRVLIGEALLCRPSVLIADEPAAALDVETRNSVLGLIKDQQQKLGFGLLVITHDRKTSEWADSVVALTESEARATINAEGTTGESVLRVRGLRKSYGHTRALDGVNLDVMQGARLMISGESGAGKSTLARCLAGWETADAGSIEFPKQGSPQMIPQNPGESLNPEWEAWEIVAEGLRLGGIKRDDARRDALVWIDRVGLRQDMATRKSGVCSGGEKARLAIARALAAAGTEKPALLIFDESFSGLDIGMRAQILDLLVELQRERPISYVVITHDEWLAQRFGKQFAAMEQGKLTG